MYAKPADRLKQALAPRIHRVLAHALGRFGYTFEDPAYYTLGWALHPLDLEIRRGETVAIIGRNGSGKSTLLQLICGTLTPSTGEVTTNGRVGALLELGSGFNPEYTGRENVYLNASVLGFTREKTEARLADIIGFADIGEFIDRPVKTYSSGMTMRLAFSVIANIDSDILVIDEALAVGDAYFQQKCLRWLRRFQETGTVLFCSHDVSAVLSLCTRAVWLDDGQVKMAGTAKEVCEAYNAFVHRMSAGLIDTTIGSKAGGRGLSSSPEGRSAPQKDRPENAPSRLPPAPDSAPAVFDLVNESDRFGSGLAEILDATLVGGDGSVLSWIEGSESVRLTIRARALADLTLVILGFIVKDRLGQPLFGDNTLQRGGTSFDVRSGEVVTATFAFDLPLLAAGRYSVTLAIASGTLENHVQHHWLHDGLAFDVRSSVGGVMFALATDEVSVDVTKGTSDAGEQQ